MDEEQARELRSRLAAIAASKAGATPLQPGLETLWHEGVEVVTLASASRVIRWGRQGWDTAAALRVEVEDLRPLREAMGTQAAADVLAERRRQVEQEGWTHEHDEGHPFGELAEAAACYAAACADPEGSDVPLGRLGVHWPWIACWWKPSKDPRRNLVKAGALILAEIERLDRCRLSAAPQGEVQP